MQDMAAILASLLRQGRGLDRLSRGLTLIGAAAVFLAPSPWFGAGVVLAGAAQSWFAFRVGFDAELFAALARGDRTLSAMDSALVSLALVPEARTGRDIALRGAGARRLLLWQGAAVAAQLALCVLAAAWGA